MAVEQPVIPGRARQPEAEFGQQLAHLESTKDYLSVGNLGEQIALRLLTDLGYHVLGCQDDYLGIVPEILGFDTRANPEDFIAIDPNQRLVTVNSKASITQRACRVLKTGDLSRPRLRRQQAEVAYSTLRANLVTPIEGDSFTQIIKIDLLHLLAQVFEVQDSGVTVPWAPPQDIADYARDVLRKFPGRIPPPNLSDLT